MEHLSVVDRGARERQIHAGLLILLGMHFREMAANTHDELLQQCIKLFRRGAGTLAEMRFSSPADAGVFREIRAEHAAVYAQEEGSRPIRRLATIA